MAQAVEVLKRFVHVSDLHIGDVDPQSGDALVPKSARRIFQNLTYLDGLLGHHGRALRELAEFCAKFSERKEPFELLVTGDFTRCGSASEIATAQRFFTASVDLNAPNGNLVGLNLGAVPEASITGNHDQWGGTNRPWGGGPLASQALVPQDMPFVLTSTLANGRRLLLAGIDTDADISPKGVARVLARGSFRNQLVALEQKLPTRTLSDIRVLMLHHSMAHDGFALKIDHVSKAALFAFLADQRFSLVLSGHTHEQLFSKIPIQSSSGAASVIEELTCGSTTQHDQVPYNWRSLLGNRPARAWPANTLLVHTLVGVPGATVWQTEAFVRLSGLFQSMGVLGKNEIPV
jgi:DNA repair exonuclease SbcCD nuclease subunit